MLDVALNTIPNFHYGRITRVIAAAGEIGLLTIPVPTNFFHRRIWMGVEPSGAGAQRFQGEIVAMQAGQVMSAIPFDFNYNAGVLTTPCLILSSDNFNALIQPDTFEAAFIGGQRLTAFSFTSIADEIGLSIRQNSFPAGGTFQFHVRSQTKF